MKSITRHAWILFAIASIAFGVIQLASGDFNHGLLPVPASVPVRKMLLYACAVILMVLGSALLFNKCRYRAAVLLGFFYFLFFLLVHLFPLLADVYNANKWTAAVEMISLCSGAFFIAAMRYPAAGNALNPSAGKPVLTVIARYGYSFALLVFAFLHFKYAAFIATLIPAWVPFKLFLALFIGAGFAASAISILINRLTYQAMVTLGIMFCVWVFILHLPRAMAKMTDEPEWTSLFVALAFSGLSFTLAILSASKNPFRVTIPST